MPERASKRPAPPHVETPHVRAAHRRSDAVREARRSLRGARLSPARRAMRWLFDPEASEAERLAEGGRHVRTGAALCVMGLLAYLSADVAEGVARWPSFGVLAGVVAAALGVVAGSRIARVVMTLIAIAMFFSVDEALGQLHRHRLGYGGFPPAYVYTHISAALGYVAGTLLANVTPGALAHHRARRAATMSKRRHVEKSLAEWRHG
jgi:hypothetical protein